jgi:hypothetical protein
MIFAALFFFGTTLIYTGILVSGRDLTTGLALAFTGLILIIKPALYAARYCQTHFGSGPRPQGNKSEQKVKKRKVHLKIVKSEDDKPTIH